MHRLFGVPRSGLGLDPDILGAIFFDERRIVIDESLDPEENPSKEGRYRFTLAHEGGGHWRLHRRPVRQGPGAGLACSTSRPPPTRDLPVEPGEGARRVAGGFLCVVPADAAQAGHRRMGRDASRTASRAFFSLPTPIDHPFVEIARIEMRRSASSMHARPTIRCSTASPSPSPSSSSSRRSPCASGWKSSGCCIATVPLQRHSVRWRVDPFFEEIVKCQLDER